jgi:hypothetical protein
MVENGEAFCAYPNAMNNQHKADYDFSEPMFYTVSRFFY